MNTQLRSLPLLVISLALTFTLISIKAHALDVEHFVAKIKQHYESAPKLDAFALNYHYLGGGDPYGSWDYQSPERYIAIRMVEIDLEQKHFFENDIHHFAGGRTVDRVQFQNDTESLFYDRNGLTLGNGILQQSMDTFDEIKGHIFRNLDFLAVLPVLEESDISTRIKLHQDADSGNITLVHQDTKGEINDYVFAQNPLQLLSIHNRSAQRLSKYDNYQTINGVTFARSILKYYNGAATPNFIHRIDQLHILKGIDPNRFNVPEEFGSIIPDSNNILASTKIAPNLYLVTDSPGWRNSLFKVNDDEIMIYGAFNTETLAEQSIALINKAFPDKIISSVYVTHPHSHQIRGLHHYAKHNIAIAADTYTIEAIKAYPPFEKVLSTFKFQTIEHEQKITNTQYFVLENSHAKRQGFVFFEDLGIIYQSKFLEVALDNKIAHVMPSHSKTFIDFIGQKQLKFTRIVSHHRNNNITREVVEEIDNAFR